MATYVLIHGGWSGGWIWKKVVPLLRDAGHEVFTPTLTGLGERSHLGHANVGLSTHIQDVVNVLEYEDLREVVLVGHSYGGMVATGVADRVLSRINHLVYVDAFAPRHGQALVDFEGGARRVREQQALDQGDGWQIPPVPVHVWRDTMAMTNEADIAWQSARVGPAPLKAFTEVISLSADTSALPQTYIHCTFKPAGDPFVPFVERAKAVGWRVRTLPTGHRPMVTMPRELADLLLDVAGTINNR